jgi:hypothetical protein
VVTANKKCFAASARGLRESVHLGRSTLYLFNRDASFDQAGPQLTSQFSHELTLLRSKFVAAFGGSELLQLLKVLLGACLVLTCACGCSHLLQPCNQDFRRQSALTSTCGKDHDQNYDRQEGQAKEVSSSGSKYGHAHQESACHIGNLTQAVLHCQWTSKRHLQTTAPVAHMGPTGRGLTWHLRCDYIQPPFQWG